MKTLRYNFNHVARIPNWLYNRIWNCGDLWSDENADLFDRLCAVVGEHVFEINCTPEG